MISKQTVFLTEDRTKVVKEGDPKAKFLLVLKGHDIAPQVVEKYGAESLVGNGADAPKSDFAESHPLAGSSAEGPSPENREADLKLRKRGGKKRSK